MAEDIEGTMLITRDFPPETERDLCQRAIADGQTMEGFIRELVEREVVTTGGPHMVPMPRPSNHLDEILEPVRRESEESGMTDEGLVQFLTDVRDEVRKEKRLRKSP
jgi:hypothetical protein